MTESKKSNELPAWIADHLARYIATDGADGYLWDASLGGGSGMVPTLLLTTTGRKSGRSLTMPLIFGQSGADYVIVASKGGAPEHPAWYLNLDANPNVVIQVKADKFSAKARTATGEERADCGANWSASTLPMKHTSEKRTAKFRSSCSNGWAPASVKKLLEAANAAVPKLAPADLKKMLTGGDVLLVDVRDHPEVASSGKIKAPFMSRAECSIFERTPAHPITTKPFKRIARSCCIAHPAAAPRSVPSC